MLHLMLLTVHLSLLLLFTHSTPVVEPLRVDHGLQHDQDLPDFTQPLFGTQSTSDTTGGIDSTSNHCYGNTDGLQPLEKRQGGGACYPISNDDSIDDIVPYRRPEQLGRSSRTVDRVIPSRQISDDEDCGTYLPGAFLNGKMFLWSVCDSGTFLSSLGDVVQELDLSLPGYVTYALYHAILCRFIRGQCAK